MFSIISRFATVFVSQLKQVNYKHIALGLSSILFTAFNNTIHMMQSRNTQVHLVVYDQMYLIKRTFVCVVCTSPLCSTYMEGILSLSRDVYIFNQVCVQTGVRHIRAAHSLNYTTGYRIVWVPEHIIRGLVRNQKETGHLFLRPYIGIFSRVFDGTSLAYGGL